MVSDAQPRPPDLDPFRRRRPSAGVGPGLSALCGVVNAVRRRTGHFWQGRFGAVAMDEDHLAAAFRYVSLNPVRARLAARAQDWRWSSARAHLAFGADGWTATGPPRAPLATFADFAETGRPASGPPPPQC